MTSANSARGSDDLVLERLGQQPAELGELALDAPGAEPDVGGAEEHLVLLDDDLESLAADRGATTRTRSASARAGTIAVSSSGGPPSSGVVRTAMR